LSGTKRKRQARYPVEFVASELGVDRKRLVARLEAAGFATQEGIKFREAFEALTAKADQESDRARRLKAEAESAEIDAATKKGELMLTSNHVRWVREYGTEVRSKTMQAAHISQESKRKLCNAFAEIRVK
jgi:hypothetical protein